MFDLSHQSNTQHLRVAALESSKQDFGSLHGFDEYLYLVSTLRSKVIAIW